MQTNTPLATLSTNGQQISPCWRRSRGIKSWNTESSSQTSRFPELCLKFASDLWRGIEYVNCNGASPKCQYHWYLLLLCYVSTDSARSMFRKHKESGKKPIRTQRKWMQSRSDLTLGVCLFLTCLCLFLYPMLHLFAIQVRTSEPANQAFSRECGWS